MADFTSGIMNMLGRPNISPNQFDKIGSNIASVINGNQEEDERLTVQYTSALLNAAPEQRQAIVQKGLEVGAFDEEDAQEFSRPFEQIAPVLASYLQSTGNDTMLPDSYRNDLKSNKPSAVLETEWYNNQSPEVQKAHMDLKRRAQESPEAKLAYQEQLNNIKLDLEKQKLLIQSNVSAATSDQDAETQADIQAGKKLGELRGDILADETSAYRNSKSKSLQLKQLESALNAATTGKPAQLRSFAGKYLPGVNVDDEQALQSIITQYALDELRTQSGPKTDFDFIKAAETQIQAGNTKGANKIILERMKENQKYAESRYKAFKKFKAKNKNFEDFEDSFSYGSDPFTPGQAQPQPAAQGQANSGQTLTPEQQLQQYKAQRNGQNRPARNRQGR